MKNTKYEGGLYNNVEKNEQRYNTSGASNNDYYLIDIGRNINFDFDKYWNIPEGKRCKKSK